jgi:hypothetical protein
MQVGHRMLQEPSSRLLALELKYNPERELRIIAKKYSVSPPEIDSLTRTCVSPVNRLGAGHRTCRNGLLNTDVWPMCELPGVASWYGHGEVLQVCPLCPSTFIARTPALICRLLSLMLTFPCGSRRFQLLCKNHRAGALEEDVWAAFVEPYFGDGLARRIIADLLADSR